MSVTIPPDMEAKLAKFGRLAAEFHDESDRGCAILVMCVLEDCLRDMLLALVPDPEASLGRLAPPGGTGATIDSAMALGLLSKRQAHSFRQLVAIRNRFAHSVMEGITFTEPSIAKMVADVVPAVAYPEDASLNNDTARGWYLMHAASLWILMAVKTESIQRLPAAPDFDASKGLPPGFVPPT